MTAPTLVRLDGMPDVAYTVDRQTFGARPACPRCGWRSAFSVTASSMGWRAWIVRDVRQHECANPDQEKPS